MLNEFYQNIKTSEYFSRYGVFNAVKRGLFIADPLHCIGDYETKKLLWQRYATKKIKKYLKYKNTNPDGLSFNADIDRTEPIWIFWNNGIENAPKIVQICYRSVVKHSERKVILLDEEKIRRYITFPKYIMDKVNTGNIPMAGYTDLMRFALLEHYGGTWIDATVYLSGAIPEKIFDADFFAFQNSMCLVEKPVLYPAWFLHAKAGSRTIREVRNTAFAYWTKEKHVIEYLLPNLIITEILKNDLEIKKNMPYMNSDYSEYLIRCLGEHYSKEKMDWICELTSIHKLTYKLNKKIGDSDTFYKHIIEDNL